MRYLVSSGIVLAGLAVVAGASVLQAVILLVLLPFRSARIRSCIVFERIVGHACTRLAGARIEISGRGHLDPRRPAIYVVNHSSMLDLFITLRYMPFGAVGVVKKEVIYYPFFGQLYLLTGHLRVDRGHHAAAVASMRSLGELVRRAKLSIVMSPEGTRARDGRLLPFKRGMAHLAIQTGLPIVPVVIMGAHRVLRSDSLSVRGGTVRVQVLPAMSTSHWTVERTNEATEEIHRVFRDHLPEDQQPASPTPPGA
ncbi:MAG: 1-acyl-sn-glycerol-3-phosphate acyltransferase [Deltaproteobacteria bacterium]|nr:1-acyl-sn-glycerol-3-phosphate acyltransferase [Deltaproteobacteria bacterium]